MTHNTTHSCKIQRDFLITRYSEMCYVCIIQQIWALIVFPILIIAKKLNKLSRWWSKCPEWSTV